MKGLYLGYALVILMAAVAALTLVSGRGGFRRGAGGISAGLRAWLFSIAGVSPDLARRCPPGDQVWYSTLGAAMLLIAALAAMGMGLSVYQFTAKTAAAVFAGVFWGLLILVVDRLMVVAIDKYEPAWKSCLKAAPRLLMVITLSFVVSHTVIQWMFANDLDRELAVMLRQTRDAINAPLRERRDEINRRVDEINEALKPIDAKIRELNRDIAKELAGKGDSGLTGEGKVVAALRESRDREQSLRNQFLDERAQFEAGLKELDQRMEANNRANEQVLNAAPGILDRARAVQRLCANNSQARLLYWALMIALSLIESTPVLSKLLSRPTHYDEMAHHKMQRAGCARMIRTSIYGLIAQREPDDARHPSFTTSPLIKDFWLDIENVLRDGMTITRDQEPFAGGNAAVTVYLAEPGRHAEQDKLFINFGLAKHEVLGAHLFKALEKAGVVDHSDHFNWLTLGRFEIFNRKGEAVRLDAPLFAQITGDVAFAASAFDEARTARLDFNRRPGGAS